MRQIRILTLLVTLAGCSSGDNTLGPGGDGSGSPTDGGSPSDDGAQNDGGGTCTGCDDFFPLAVGRSWDYTIARGARSGCNAGTLTLTITGTGTDADGDTFFTRTPSCGNTLSLDFKRVGGTVYVRVRDFDWYVFLTLPPVDGATFAAGGASGAQFRLRAMPSVSVPEGTHTGCFQKEQIGYDNREVYCPGVGMVSGDYHEWEDEGYDLTATR